MNEILLYQTEDGQSKIELHLQEGTVWLTRLEIAELFQTSKQNIGKHIKTNDHGRLEGRVKSVSNLPTG